MLVLWVAAFATACSDDEPATITTPPSSERGHLVSYSKTGSMAAAKTVSINAGLGDISAYATHDIDIYSVVYNSVEAGTPLQVSGLVMVPREAIGNLHVVQHHHGTIIPWQAGSSTPSNYTGGNSDNSEVHFIGATFAANGYVVSLPDYVGYGITENREHPYTMHHALAEVSVDMLRATQQLIRELALGFSGKVFLTGWSEGGGAGLATHKSLQTEHAGEFEVAASSLLAGPYDYLTFTQAILSSRDESFGDNMSIYNWSLYSLNKRAGMQREAATIWRYAVTDQWEALEVPSSRPSGVFQPAFMDAVEQGSDAAYLAAAGANGLIEGWVPQGSLFFHSGTNDRIVPHFNSVNAHQHFQSINVNSTLYEYPGGDHYTPEYDYVTTTLDDFNALR